MITYNNITTFKQKLKSLKNKQNVTKEDIMLSRTAEYYKGMCYRVNSE